MLGLGLGLGLMLGLGLGLGFLFDDYNIFKILNGVESINICIILT